MAQAGDELVPGLVDSIDDELARVLIGPEEDEWFFPVVTLPDGVEAGNVVGFVQVDGRWSADGFISRESEDSIERRLSRGINKRRTAELARADLRAAIDGADS